MTFNLSSNISDNFDQKLTYDNRDISRKIGTHKLTNTQTNKEQEAFRERRHLHVFDLRHVIVTFSLSQELLDYLIKCYPVDIYNFDLSLLILAYIPPVIFHVKFCEQLEAHVFNLCRSYDRYYKVEHIFTSLDSAVG